MPLLRNKRRCDHYGSDSGIIQTPNLSDPFDISNHPDIHYQAMYLLPGCCRHSATTPIKLLNAVRLLVTDSTQFSKRLSFPFQWTIWTEYGRKRKYLPIYCRSCQSRDESVERPVPTSLGPTTLRYHCVTVVMWGGCTREKSRLKSQYSSVDLLPFLTMQGAPVSRPKQWRTFWGHQDILDRIPSEQSR